MTIRRVALVGALLVTLGSTSRASTVTSDPNLPQLFPGAAYFYVPNQPTFPGVTATFDAVQDRALGPVLYNYLIADEEESYNTTWVAEISLNGQPFTPVTASGSELALVRSKLGMTTGTFNTELLSMNVSGNSSYGPFMIRESPTKASTGQTTITPLSGNLYQVDSFFDVFTELSLDGGQTWYPSQGPTRVILQPAPEPSGGELVAAGLLALYALGRARRYESSAAE